MKSSNDISAASSLFIWSRVIVTLGRIFTRCFPRIDSRSMPEKNSLNRAVFSNLRRSDVIDVESPRCSRCADQELSPIQRNIMESMPELTGVWFYRGEVRGKVNLDRTPNHGWFEMYVEKTGELQTSPIPTGGTLSTP